MNLALRLALTFACLAPVGLFAADASPLQSGPMVGYAEMREAQVWVQTREPAKLQLAYWPKTKPGERSVSAVVEATPANACTAKLLADNVTPGTRYAYEVLVDGRPVAMPHTLEFQTLPNFRDRTPPPDFSMALGGGNYVNDIPYEALNRRPGDEHSIFLAILAKAPDAMLWLGNSTYLRDADWGSRTGYLRRYTDTRSLPELQPLLGSVHHYAVWSWGECGPATAAQGLHLYNRATATEAFRLFWANPTFGVADLPGTATQFRWADADFFLLDDRTFRDTTPANPAKRVVLGQAQVDWLLASLKRSRATFKIVVCGSPILNPIESEHNLTAAPIERERLLEALREARINGLVFLSGGKDFGEITKMVRANAYDLYEFTICPLTARPVPKVEESNFFRVPNSVLAKRHFGLLRVTGPEDARVFTVTLYDAVGNELGSQKILASQLGYGAGK